MPSDPTRPSDHELLPIGIFARTFAGTDPDQVLRMVADSGIRHVQFNLVSAGMETVPSTIDQSVVARIATSTRQHNVIINALSGTCNLSHPDASRREEYVTRLIRLAKLCDTLAIPVLTLSTGTRDPDDLWRSHPDNSSDAAQHDLHQSLRHLLAATAGTLVTFAFEPETANVVQSADQAAELCAACDAEFGLNRLAVILDLANLIGSAPLTEQAAILQHACGRLEGRIVLAHAKDLDAEHRVVPPGQGQIDFAAYLRALREVAGYIGPVIMHGLSPNHVPDSVAHLTTARRRALR